MKMGLFFGKRKTKGLSRLPVNYSVPFYTSDSPLALRFTYSPQVKLSLPSL